jgi:hypothetical protein
MNETEIKNKVCLILEVSKKILDESKVIKYTNIKEERMLIFAIAKIVSEHWDDENGKG